MTTSHILTDEEIDALYNHSTDRAFDLARMVEAAVIAKLSERVVLPEGVEEWMVSIDSCNEYYGWEEADSLDCRTTKPTDPDNVRVVYTSTQMREAFAQGAASQFSRKEL